MTKYEAKFHDSGGNFVTYLNEFERLQWIKSLNDVGTLEFRIPAFYLPYSTYQKDGRLEIWRFPEHAQEQLVGVYFLYKRRRETIAGIDTVSVWGVDQNHLLARRIIDAAAGSAGADKSGAADTVMREYVLENLGASASADRQMSGVSLETAKTLGPTVTKGASRDNLLMTLQALSMLAAQKGTRVFFEIVPFSATSFQFQTFSPQRGTYRGLSATNGQLVLAEDRGTLANTVLEEDAASEVTMAYAGGLGIDDMRNVQNTGDLSKTGINRIEIFRDSWNSGTSNNALLDEARSIIRELRPRISFKGEIVNNADNEYGVHWGFGDTVVAEYSEYRLDCDVNLVIGTVDNKGNEDIQAGIGYVN